MAVFTCPNCAHSEYAPDDYVGRIARCVKCEARGPVSPGQPPAPGQGLPAGDRSASSRPTLSPSARRPAQPAAPQGPAESASAPPPPGAPRRPPPPPRSRPLPPDPPADAEPEWELEDSEFSPVVAPIPPLQAPREAQPGSPQQRAGWAMFDRVTGKEIYILIGLVAALLALQLFRSGWAQISAPAWEYTIESPSDRQFDEELDRLGREGWELVSARRATSSDGPSYEMILKRPRVWRLWGRSSQENKTGEL